MAQVNLSLEPEKKSVTKRRFISLDFARGIAIVAMIVLHVIGDYLNIDVMLAYPNINNLATTNLFALILLPFFGGLAGFFLLVSAIANMVSMQRHLERGKSIRSLVIKQIVGGVLLLIFAMLSESTFGYHGVVGNFFRNLNNPAAGDYTTFLWQWNTFETVHTIAWCLILNGIVQGLLSLNGNWKNTRKMIISYIVLGLVVVGLTQPIWDLVGLIGPGYPWGTYANGHQFAQPWIGTEPFWDIFRAPFLTALAAPMEPIFPYLAVSFMGSIIGLVISQPKEKISKHFPKKVFIVGGVMFISGVVGILFAILKIMNASYPPGTDSFDVAINFYRFISFHRHWAPDNALYMSPGITVPIMPFSWLFQFLALNGFSLMAIMLLFRLIEFRGRGKAFAKRTKNIRRYGIVAFSNYNNQSIYVVIFFLISLMITKVPYQKLFWSGTVLSIFLTLVVFSLILYGWEKIKYTGSLEWFIRTVTNNLVPARKDRFDKSMKWWQKGQVDVENTFYNAEWVNLDTTETEVEKEKTNDSDSRFAIRLALVSLCSIFFIVVNIISLFVSLRAKKIEGKNKHNTAGLAISISGVVILVGVLITTLVIKVGALGLF